MLNGCEDDIRRRWLRHDSHKSSFSQQLRDRGIAGVRDHLGVAKLFSGLDETGRSRPSSTGIVTSMTITEGFISWAVK